MAKASGKGIVGTMYMLETGNEIELKDMGLTLGLMV